MKFTDRLQELKKQKNVMQKTVADEVGVSLRAYQYYETGTNEPTLSVLVRIADYFDVSLDYLVGRSDNPKRS